MQPNSPIAEHFRLMPIQKKALAKLGILTIEDLLYHFPVRYGDTSEMKNIASLVKGETAVIFGKISGLKTSKAFIKKIPMGEAKITDDTGSIKCIWFYQPYLAKMFVEESLVRIEGKVSQKKSGELYFTNPKMEKVSKLPIGVGDSLFGENGEKHTLYPIYPESRGITSNWIYHAIQKIFKSGILDALTDSIPKELLQKYNLPTLKTALIWIHSPLKTSDAQSARKRFAFEEVFYIQIAKQQSKIAYQKNPSFIISKNRDEVEEFVKRFPFEATNAQRKAVDHILHDFKKGNAMSRLLHGDVGSGKTAVAAVSAYAVVTNKLQVAYMCPTEILAKQHFESFIKYFSYLNIQIGLITGSGCRKFPSKVNPKGWTDISRSQLLKWVANGEIAILVGTHALIQKTVKFKKLAYVIIDEQHRFGTNQRQKLAHKTQLAPHFLSMTATPIPRTLALTVYGDLDLTLLDEMPKGRKPIITEIVLPNKRDETYSKIKEELKIGRQLYVICPRISEPDPDKEQVLNVKSVTEEAKRLKKDIFQKYEIGIMHSKMTTDEKEKVMIDFEKNKIQILIATSVVEVGVNVPNATIIIIEGGERFGLAQLHQFRGRVLRSNHQAYCYVFAESKTDKTLKRLEALGQAKNGFELAEFDLAQRGAGELYGRKQWGLSDVAMEAIKNIKMVEAARLEAAQLLSTNETLSNYPLIKQHLASHKTEEIHFE
ncbi:MAG: ATP-dependent DNA helicase RecG [Patescibacteria group bacterium]